MCRALRIARELMIAHLSSGDFVVLKTTSNQLSLVSVSIVEIDCLTTPVETTGMVALLQSDDPVAKPSGLRVRCGFAE
jgi:hypothetical protein